MKGYMIFVDGKHPPKAVFKTFGVAMIVMKRLAKKNPHAEIMLFQLHKRAKFDPATNKLMKLGTHIPMVMPPNGMCYLPDLVLKKDSPAEILDDDVGIDA